MNKGNDYEAPLKWCLKGDNIYLDDDRVEKTIYHIMNYKLDNMNEKEAIALIKFFAHKTAIKLGVNDNLIINILSLEEYKQTRQYDRGYKCWYKCINGIDNVFYTPETIKELTSNNTSEFLIGLKNICHEIVHVYDNKVVIEGKTINKYAYIIALERIVRRLGASFYMDNYNNLFLEKHANKLGLELALEYVKEYNSKLCNSLNQDNIREAIDSYSYDLNIQLSDDKSEFSQVVLKARSYIANNPSLLNEFPILKLGYKTDGTPKDLKELLDDRNEFLKYCDSKDIDELYLMIISCLNNKNIKNDLTTLCDYLYDNAIIDEFALDLLRIKLEKLCIDVDKVINGIRQDIKDGNTKKV